MYELLTVVNGVRHHGSAVCRISPALGAASLEGAEVSSIAFGPGPGRPAARIDRVKARLGVDGRGPLPAFLRIVDPAPDGRRKADIKGML